MQKVFMFFTHNSNKLFKENVLCKLYFDFFFYYLYNNAGVFRNDLFDKLKLFLFKS